MASLCMCNIHSTKLWPGAPANEHVLWRPRNVNLEVTWGSANSLSLLVGEETRMRDVAHGITNFGFPFSSRYSFLQPPKPLSSLSTLRDGNWRDGCYWCSSMYPWRMGKKWKWGLCYLAGWVTVDAGIFFPFCILTLLHCFSVDQSPETNYCT